MYSHEYKIRVRYGDTDQMGVVYYGNYPRFYEIGRMELLRSLGLSYVKWEEEYNTIMPVVSMDSRYMYPARYDDELRIKTILEELPSKMISFDHFRINSKVDFRLLRGFNLFSRVGQSRILKDEKVKIDDFGQNCSHSLHSEG